LVDAQIAAVTEAMTYLQELAGAKEKKQARATRQTKKATTSPARRSKKHPKTPR